MDSPTPQAELALDHSPALETAMRTLFVTRWSRWHPKPFEEAMKDAVTRRLLVLAVQHEAKAQASRLTPGARRRGFQNVKREAAAA